MTKELLATEPQPGEEAGEMASVAVQAESPHGIAPSADSQLGETGQPAAPPLPDLRRRLRELLAIPDRERTDALWDELIELEIQLAPGNRALPPGAEPGRNPKQAGRLANPGRRQESSGLRHNNRPPGHAPGGGNGATPGTPGAPRPGKRFFKKARRGPRPAG